MPRKIDVVKRAAEAHTNLNTWGAVIALLEGGLLYGAGSNNAAVRRVLVIARKELGRFLSDYDDACNMMDRP